MSWDNLLWVGTIAIKQGLYYRARACTYAALHRYEKRPSLKAIAPTSDKNFIHIQLVEKIENGKRMVSVNIFTSKCLGTTPLQYWTRWNDEAEKEKQSLTSEQEAKCPSLWPMAGCPQAMVMPCSGTALIWWPAPFLLWGNGACWPRGHRPGGLL